MARSSVENIANAVLYEGYILYPYRPALKNRQRWTFGGLYPSAASQVGSSSEACSMQAECLVLGNSETRLDVTVRFLHLMDRTAGRVIPPLPRGSEGREPQFQPVDVLRVGDARYASWQEATERRVEVQCGPIGDALGATELPAHSEFADRRRGKRHLQETPNRRRETSVLRRRFGFPAKRTVERVVAADGAVAGVLVRQQQKIEGIVEVSVAPVRTEVYRVRVRVLNETPLEDPAAKTRDELLMRSLVSTHAILHVQNGEFVSMIDPPEACRADAAECQNVGSWPVLVGDEGQTDTILAAPIILYDYPQVAPESPGDLFDGTEIDEILTLRIMTLTDDEKQEMAAVDQRASDLLARTETLCRDQLMNLHGTIRHVKPYDEITRDE